jgi:hypothetical protein
MLVDSKKRMLDPQEIILEASRQIKSKKYSPDQILAGLITEANAPDTILMRQGNTLYIIHKGENRTALYRALNADTADNFLENGVMYAKAMYMAGFDVMVTQFEDPILLKIFPFMKKNRTRINKDMDGKPTMGYAVQEVEKSGVKEYRVTTVLGPRREGQVK